MKVGNQYQTSVDSQERNYKNPYTYGFDFIYGIHFE